MKACAAVLLAASCCACAGSPQRAASGPAHRIVSLMPSLTEDLCALGARPQIVGVSEYSQDIPCVKGVPQVGNASSIDTERILSLHADAVAGIPAQRLLTEPVRRAGIPVRFFPDDTYAEIFSDIVGLGRLSGRSAQASRLVADLQARTGALRRAEHFRRRLSVFVVVQAQPIWTVGPHSYIAQLIALAGGSNAVQSLPRPYAQYSAEALVRLQPDVVIAPSDSGLRLALDREPWRSLRAVETKRVYFPADDSILVRPGPRYNEGLQWLIERLQQAQTGPAPAR